MGGKLAKRISELNIADYFSLYRFVSLPAIVTMIFFQFRIATGILLIVSFATDAIDGYLARKREIESARGARLDSIGDLLTLLAGFAAFIVFGTAFFLDHLWLFAGSTALYFIQFVLAFVKFGTFTSFHTWLAKITAVLFGGFLIHAVLFQPHHQFFYITFAISIADALEEIAITILLKEPRNNVKGLYWLLRRKPGND